MSPSGHSQLHAGCVGTHQGSLGRWLCEGHVGLWFLCRKGHKIDQGKHLARILPRDPKMSQIGIRGPPEAREVDTQSRSLLLLPPDLELLLPSAPTMTLRNVLRSSGVAFSSSCPRLCSSLRVNDRGLVTLLLTLLRSEAPPAGWQLGHMRHHSHRQDPCEDAGPGPGALGRLSPRGSREPPGSTACRPPRPSVGPFVNS